MSVGRRSGALGVVALVVCALLLAVHAPAGAAAAKPKTVAAGLRSALPNYASGTSVAVSPSGEPWFGTYVPSEPVLGRIEPGQSLSPLYLAGELPQRRLTETSALQFDAGGNLWFVKSERAGSVIMRRAPDGALTEFEHPAGLGSRSLAIGPAGEVWFTRNHRIGYITATGAHTEFRLGTAVSAEFPVAGPDGAIWFIDSGRWRIGRITADGERKFFALGRGVHPDELAGSPNGALWFSENAHKAEDGTRIDRIGRLTTSGKVTQFTIPFGHRTGDIAAGPEGRIWFATDEAEISSISASGDIGAHRCILGLCRSGIIDLAAAPDGSLWFVTERVFERCDECGGFNDLLRESFGAPVGRIDPGTLAPAPVS